MYNMKNVMKAMRMGMVVMGIVAAVQWVGAEMPSSGQLSKQRIALFNYDKTAEFGIKEMGVEKRGSISIRDITFVGVPGKEPVKAYVVTPDGVGPFAGILWMHWLGEHKSDRNQYLEEAVALASKGTVSVLSDAMWSVPSWYQNRVPEQDYASSIRQVIEIRRAMDLLLSQKHVDKARIGFVGHDFGGMYGAIAAGVDPRAKTYVFIAVTPSLSDWAFFGRQPKSKVDYIRQNAVFELTDFLGQLTGSALCQFSKNDPFISRTGGSVFFRAIASPVKDQKRYDAGHEMEGATIVSDRDAWLIKELELGK